MRLIAIAGTVGIGKSTLTKKLSEKLNYQPLFEETSKNPYLERFYNNPRAWAFHLQIYFLAEKFKTLQTIHETNENYIQDRSIFEDGAIFAKMNFEKELITAEDYAIYNNLFNSITQSKSFVHPDLIIYLESDLESSLQRIRSRGRIGENKTEIEYWKKLHKKYNEWINTFTATPILVINIKEYDVNDDKTIDLLVAKINAKIKL